MSEQETPEQGQSISFSVEQHPITGQPVVGVTVADRDGSRATVRLSSDDAITTSARLSAIGQFVFSMEQSAHIQAQRSPGIEIA